MKNIKDIKQTLKDKKTYLSRNYKVKKLGVFGSYSQGTANKKSDVDILVSFSKTPDLFEFLRLEDFLKDLLGARVDLVTPEALKPVIKQEILKETVYL